MSYTDKARNEAEEAKEWIGDRTDNEDLQAEGMADQAKANAKQAGEHVKDAAEDVADTFRQ